MNLSRRSLFALSFAGLGQGIQASTTPYQRPKVKITDIKTAEVRVHGHQTHVRIYTDAGLIQHPSLTLPEYDFAISADALFSGI